MLSRSGELECLCITGCSLCEKKVQKFLKKFNTELPYDPVILLLEQTENTQKQGLRHSTSMFIMPLFMMVKKKGGDSPKFPDR